MPKERIITGIDIGSSKVCTIIATTSGEGKVSVIGVSSVPSRGVKKGVIIDIDEAVEAIALSLEGAERMAGYAVSAALVTVNGKHISSLNSHGVVAVAHQDGEIIDGDVARVTEAAQAISIPSSREIIHVIPRGFIVDNQDEIRDPIGMSGVRLEVETNIISGGSTIMRNLTKCVQQVGVDPLDLVFTGISASEAVLTDTEKELGTVLIDLGGGTTSVVVFSGGSPGYSVVLPIGGQNITTDLAAGLRMSLEDAERIKIRLSQKERLPVRPGGAVEGEAGEKRHPDEVDISDLGLDRTTISRKLVESVIEARLAEVFRMVAKEVKSSEYSEKLPAGVVLTGGGAETLGAEQVAKRVLGLPLRIGYPRGVTGLIDEIGSPAYAGSVGLVLYGAYLEPRGGFSGMVSRERIGGIFSRVLEWFKSFLP